MLLKVSLHLFIYLFITIYYYLSLLLILIFLLFIIVAQKTQFTKFETIIVPFIVVYVVIGFLALFFGSIVWLVPFFIVFFLALALRFHIVKKYQIQQNVCFVEFLLGFFCCPCSISQSKFILYYYFILFQIILF